MNLIANVALFLGLVAGVRRPARGFSARWPVPYIGMSDGASAVLRPDRGELS
jgi:hypothetical protein